MKKRTYSLRSRVSSAFLLAVVIMMILAELAAAVFIKPIFIYDSRRQMISFVNELETVDDKSEIADLMYDLYDSYSIFVTISDGENNISQTYAFMSMRKKSESTGRKIKKYIKKYNESGENFYKVYDRAGSVARIFYVDKYKDGNYIVLDQSVRGIDQYTKIVLLFVFIVNSLMAALALMVWYFATRPFTSMINKMSRVTKEVANLDFSEKVDYNGSIKEIKDLSGSIDYLSAELEQNISKLESELEQKKMMLRNLSHEIKTPLTTIKGYTENIQILSGDNERIQKYASIMVDECNSLNILANEMMEISAFDKSDSYGKKEMTEIKDVFDEFSEKADAKNNKNVVMSCKECMLDINRQLVLSVLNNYYENAVKYGKADAPIEINGNISGDKYIISVKNYGDSIEKDELKKIWEPFYKSDKSRKRSGSYGIGLSLVREIAAAHSGEAYAESKDGITIFYFALPCKTIQ